MTVTGPEQDRSSLCTFEVFDVSQNTHGVSRSLPWCLVELLGKHCRFSGSSYTVVEPRGTDCLRYLPLTDPFGYGVLSGHIDMSVTRRLTSLQSTGLLLQPGY